MPNIGPRKSNISPRRVLDERATEDLLEIWVANDRAAWTDQAFEAIRSILLERLGELPPQASPEQPPDLLDEPPEVARAERLLKQATFYLDLGNFAKAQRDCQRAIAIAPHMAAAYNLLGLSYDGLGQIDAAIKAYRQALALEPGFEQAQQHLNETLLELEKQHKLDPAWETLGQAVGLVAEGEIEAALEACNRAIELAPFLAEAHNYRGMLLLDLERIEDAIDEFYEAIRHEPQLYAARENLAAARLAWEAELFRQLAGQDQPYDDFQAGAEFEALSQDELPEKDPTFERYGFRVPPFFLDEKAMILQGVVGHRTRPGVSGYDPLDNDFELSRLEGEILGQMLHGRFRTRNLFAIGMMIFFGGLGVMPLPLVMIAILNGELVYGLIAIILSPYIVPGALVLWNAALNLLFWPAGDHWGFPLEIDEADDFDLIDE